MSTITEAQYLFAKQRIEDLLLVDDSNPNDPNVIELGLMSDIIIEYEKEHYPIDKPTVAELISNALEEQGMTQKQLASILNISPSRVNDFVIGRSEPNLRQAGHICRTLHISPASMMQV
ncbi:MAG: helix-turn-helix transcriptional regulator [Bacteroidales bacterium]|nr:helix-turn-helix transcriptional regulator [Candidatus Colicola coprequi]